jgi:ElaB/YqjD/DUF883 family membrane-anchored ribosome-binding protein
MKKNDAIDTAADSVAEVAADAVKAGARQVKRFRSARDATDDYVRESPWKAIGIAAIAALAVSFLVMSRRER